MRDEGRKLEGGKERVELDEHLLRRFPAGLWDPVSLFRLSVVKQEE